MRGHKRVLTSLLAVAILVTSSATLAGGYYRGHHGRHYGGHQGGHYGAHYGGSYRHHGHGKGDTGLALGVGLLFGTVLGHALSRPRYEPRYRPEPYTVYQASPPSSVPAFVSRETPRYVGTTPSSTCLQQREYQTMVIVGGREVDAYGTACLQPDGSWRQGPARAVPEL